MRKLSNAFKEQQNNGVAKYLKYIDITLTDGTELHLTNDDLWDNGFKLEDAVSSGTEFEIGSVIVNQCTININNIENEFSGYAFEGAEVTCYVGLRISLSGLEETKTIPWKDIDGTSILDINGSEILLEYDDAYIEKIRMCTMTVVDAPYQNDSIISLTCQDDMRKFDKNYSRSRLQYPATRAQIIRDACDVCGVQLHTQMFDNDDYIISERPDDEGLTFRQVLAWTAQIGCQWLRCNEYGELCVGWYNEKTEAEEISQTNGYTINLESVVITGIKVTEYLEASTEEDKAGTYMYGNDGYVLGITGNKLIPKGAGDTVATMIGKKCVGLTFRPFQANRYTDIAYEAGDPVLVRDKDGKQQRSYLTQVTTQPGRLQQIECNAKSAERNSSQRYSASTQAIIAARKAAKKQVEHYDQKVEQITKLIGQGFGMYITGVKQDDGSTIYYMHDKPNLKESGYTCYWTTNGIIASLDGGTTWAIDRNGNALFNTITARGINANWINTGEFKVTDENGNEVFYVNCDTGIVRINAQTFAITGQSVADIAKKQLQNFVDEVYNIDIQKLKEQISNKIETWTQEEDPSLAWDKITEIAWRDIDGHPILDVDGKEIIVKCEETKAEHEGDLWYNPVTKEKWIYQSGNWVPEDIPDKIFNEIDGKSSIYINTPVPPYNEGDVYFTGSTILVCKTARSAGAYNADDWGKKDGYTDDSTVNNFIKDTYTPKISDLQKQIDGKVENYFKDYEPTMDNLPASEWTTEEERQKHNADTFYWLSKKATYIFCKVDGKWQWLLDKDPDIQKAMEAAAAAQDTADGKRTTFTTTPKPPYEKGDLWAQGPDGDMMRCIKAKASGNYAGSDWEKASKYTDLTEKDCELIVDKKANEIRMKAEKIMWESDNSRMSEDGTLTCANAVIKGEIESHKEIDGTEFSSKLGEATYYSYGHKTTAGAFLVENKYNDNEKGIIVIYPAPRENISAGADESVSEIYANRNLQIVARKGESDYWGGLEVFEGRISLIAGYRNSSMNPIEVWSDGNNEYGQLRGTWKLPSHFTGTLSDTTTSAANVYIGPTGDSKLRKVSSSSKRYKHDITDIDKELNPDSLYNLPVKSYTYNTDYISEEDTNYGKRMIGFIAEDVDKIYPKACQYDADGKPEMWNSQIMLPAMLKLIQEQNERIKILEEKMADLEDGGK